MNRYAQRWAKELAETDPKEIKPSDPKRRGFFGENIYVSAAGAVLDANIPVDVWYSEIKDYNFDSPGFNNKTRI